MMHEKSQSTHLIEQAQELGLLNSDWTLKCVKCNSLFPQEYRNCPKCMVEDLPQYIKIDFEI